MTEIKKQVRYWLWFYRGQMGDEATEAGIRPGSFYESLLATWTRADQGNQRKLGKGFPETFAAFCIVEASTEDQPLWKTFLANQEMMEEWEEAVPTQALLMILRGITE